jgi:hypothetical protein
VTRAYVPLNLRGLLSLRDSGELAPQDAYAVTPGLRQLQAEAGITEEEDLEYVALMVAARVSLTMLDREDAADRRRIVVAVDAATQLGDDHPAQVLIDAPVPLAGVASVHVDTDDLRPVVETAVHALPAAADGDPDAVERAELLDDEDLAWYAVQEIPDVLGG